MIKPKSIETERIIPESMDYSFLKEEGVSILQRLSGKIWTDYNEHDPGLTILENLCFALTELGYKTNFGIEDLFFIEGIDDSNFLKTFYRPEDILPSSPVTTKDFRKLIIERIKEVKNGWIIPKLISDTGTKLDGLYEILLMIDQNAEDHEAVIKEVSDLLNENRNLCEDYESIRILSPVDVKIQLDVVIKPNIVGESVYAEIVNELLDFFSPQITLYNTDELREMGFDQEQIYDNPIMQNGFILDQDLEDSDLHKVNKLFRSEIIKIVSNIEGVEQVTNFEIELDGELIKTELIQLEDYTFPNLNVDHIFEKESVSLFAGDIIYSPDYDIVRYTLETLKSKSSLTHKRYLDHGEKEFESKLDKDELEFYYSIQNTFPRNYGITEYGIPGKTTDKRKGQVNQLRGYLFFFEQIMANYLSQLVHVKKLFSTQEVLDHTYFYQTLDHLNGYNKLVAGNGEFKQTLGNLIDNFDKKHIRRNRFLDHLLARYGEEFLAGAYMAIHRESSSYAKEDFIEKTISSKLSYLNNYVSIGKDRAKGFNYKYDYTNPENTSGLQKKISLFFNITQYGFHRLAGIREEKDVSISAGKKKAGGTGKSIVFTSNNKNILAEIMGYGVDRNNYFIEQQASQSTAFFINPKSKEKIEIFKAKSLTELEDRLTQLIQRLHELNYSSEGFHFIEHILLRPLSITHKVSYYSANNNYLSSEENYTNVKTSIADFRKKLQEFGSIKKHFKIVERDKAFILQLTDSKGKVIAFNESFVLKKSATDALNDFANEFKKLKTNDQEMDDNMAIDQALNQFQSFDHDPYSLQISIVLPRWNGRFASEKMKYLYENIVKINTPAHLKVNFAWLDFLEMSEFEHYFEAWLKRKNEDDPKQPELDDLSNLIQLYLLKFQQKENRSINREIAKLKSSIKIK